LRGVTVTPAALKSAAVDVRRELGEEFFGPPDVALYYQARELAVTGNEEATLRRASGKGLDRVTAKDVQDRLARLYVPANAVLSLAGNLEGLDFHALIASQFGDIPAGAKAAPGPSPTLASHSRVVRKAGLPEACGMAGIIAPAITDSTHPAFYQAILILGASTARDWTTGAAGSRFNYSLFDDPDLARFYPPVTKDHASPQAVGETLDLQIEKLASSMIPKEVYDGVIRNVVWLFGGNCTPEFVSRLRQDPTAVNTMATTTASRVLWQGEDFWEDYRQRLVEEPVGAFDRMADTLLEAQRRVLLVFTPAP